jgi:hypothetical protein
MVSREANATAPIRQAEVGAVRDMLERVAQRFGLHPQKLAADTAYGSADMLGWLVKEQKVEPHIPVIDKTERKDGTFAATDFTFDAGANEYTCPGGNRLKKLECAPLLGQSQAACFDRVGAFLSSN